MSEIKFNVPSGVIPCIKKLRHKNLMILRKEISGISFEFENRGVVIAATNGAVLAAYYLPLEFDVEPLRVHAPPHLFNDIRGNDWCDITIINDDDAPQIRVTRPDGVSVQDSQVQVEFPVWQSAVPLSVSGEQANLQPKLTRLIEKATSHIYDSTTKLIFYQNGDGGTLVRLEGTDNLLICIMPYRVYSPPADPIPNWFKVLRRGGQAADMETGLEIAGMVK
ncbi:MAG: hypothetical protein LBG66_03165 [Gallionellaceae bacterium]|jgi:hypothetical protein|nr:hypothetical protein [Gallionellaceae bacterium]